MHGVLGGFFKAWFGCVSFQFYCLYNVSISLGSYCKNLDFCVCVCVAMVQKADELKVVRPVSSSFAI